MSSSACTLPPGINCPPNTSVRREGNGKNCVLSRRGRVRERAATHLPGELPEGKHASRAVYGGIGVVDGRLCGDGEAVAADHAREGRPGPPGPGPDLRDGTTHGEPHPQAGLPR